MGSSFRFSPKQKHLVGLFADHSLPAGGAFELGAKDFPVADKVEALVGRCPPEVRFGVKLSLFLLEWMSWYLRGKFLVLGYLFLFYLPGKGGRFSKMSRAERESYLRHWKEHRVYLFRAFFISLNSFCQMVFYSEPAVLDAIGYDGHKHGVNAGTSGTPLPPAHLLAGRETEPAGRGSR